MNVNLPYPRVERAVVLYFRLFLGALFFLSSLDKVFDVRSFAVVIGDYKLIPAFLTLPFAYLFAWTELICGVFLVFGWRIKFFGVVSAGLFAIFTLAVSISFFRGLDIDCGCFDIPIFGSGRIGWPTIIRDLVLLAMTFPLVFWRSRESE